MTIDVHTHYLPEDVVEILRARDKPPFVDQTEGRQWLHMPVGQVVMTPDYTDMADRPFCLLPSAR